MSVVPTMSAVASTICVSRSRSSRACHRRVTSVMTPSHTADPSASVVVREEVMANTRCPPGTLKRASTESGRSSAIARASSSLTRCASSGSIRAYHAARSSITAAGARPKMRSTLAET